MPVSNRRPWQFTWRLRFAELVMRLINRHLVRRITGLEHVPLEGGFIAVANHLGFADGIVLAALLDNWRRQPVHFISYSELFTNPIVGWTLRTGEGIYLDRSSKDGIERALKDAEDYITQRGHGVGIFPEAHMARPEKMRRGRPGAALLAMRTGAPVLPCGLVGFERVMPWDRYRNRMRFALPRRSIEMHFGIPLDLRPWQPLYYAADEKTRGALLEGLTTLLMRAVAGLSGQHYPYGEAALGETVAALKPPPEWVSRYL